MQICQTELEGVYLIQPQKVEDERGYFMRTWSQADFAALGLASNWQYGAVAFNHQQGTLRGMHYQKLPYGEYKLVRCTRGALYDVIVDIRPESRTYLQHIALELSQANQLAVYIPPGFAHGYQTLTDKTEASYSIASDYVLEAAAGLRWNDPQLGIPWPLDLTVISSRDACYPDFEPVNP